MTMVLDTLWQAEAAPVLGEHLQTYTTFSGEIVLPDGTQRNEQYDVTQHPAQACAVQAFDQGYARVVMAKPVQDGGTLAALVPLLRRTIRQGQTALLAYPTGESAKDIWTTKVQPILAAFGGQEPKSGGGSKGGAARVITLPGGGRFMSRAAGGRGESQQASITADVMGVDEVDDWPSMHRLELIGQRLSQSPDPLAIYTSTVKKDADSLILALWAEGTQTRIEVPCPHCGVFQTLEWERVDVESTTYACNACPAKWSEEDRRVALKHWKRKDLNPGALSFSIRWTALDSPFPIVTVDGKQPCLQALVTMYRRALAAVQRGDHALMRAFYRDRLTRAYLGDQSGDDVMAQLSPQGLQLRSKASPWGPTRHDTDREAGDDQRTYSRHIAPVPRECQFLTCAIDVQGDRVYWLLMGMDLEERQWDIAWGYEYATRQRLPTNRAQMHSILDRVDGIVRILAGRVPLVGRGVDTNYRSDDVISWLKLHPEWVPTYGASMSKAQRMAGISGEAKRKHPGIIYQYASNVSGMRQLRHMIDTTPVRLRAQRSFLLQPGQPGAAHLPEGLTTNGTDMAYLRHLCAETWDEARLSWKATKGGGRWDWLDCRVYALALALLHLRHGSVSLQPLNREPQPSVDDVNWMHGMDAGSDWNIPG